MLDVNLKPMIKVSKEYRVAKYKTKWRKLLIMYNDKEGKRGGRTKSVSAIKELLMLIPWI